MSNELLDIADKLNGYTDGEGWMITTATKQVNGGWSLIIQPIAKKQAETQEATNDNN